MKTRMMMALTLALSVGACSTNGRMLAPDPDPAGRVSPEKPSASRSRDPVCGGHIEFAGGPWSSCHRGVEYNFDCTECQTLFEETPERYVSP